MPISSPAPLFPERTPVREVALVFLLLGTVAFGGPAAHIAMMEEHVVRRRGWLTRAQFLDYLGATNLIPGPNSTELAIHIGYARAGWPGLLAAGACFILPAAATVTAIAWLYVGYGALPQMTALLYGVKPVVIAVVAQAIGGLGKSAIKSRTLAAICAAAVVAAAYDINELVILATAAVLMMLPNLTARGLPIVIGVSASPPPSLDASTTAATVPFSLGTLGLVFMKIGAVLFGSGYVLLAFLRTDLVERLGWLTERQLLDAIAVGQITPGPVFTTATFVGYILDGGAGAAVATLGIFLPAFVFVALSAPILPRLRRSPTAAAVLDGVNVASLALMLVVTWHLARSAVVDPLTVGIALASFVLLVHHRVNSAWLVVGGAVLGLVSHL